MAATCGGGAKTVKGAQPIPQSTLELATLDNGATQRLTNLPAWTKDLTFRVEVSADPFLGAPIGNVTLRVLRGPTSPLLAAEMPQVVEESTVMTAADINLAILNDRNVYGAIVVEGADQLELFNPSGVTFKGVRVQLRVVPTTSVAAQTQR